ncbi:unnamed protein product [Didymodactylos carnosus]|uniref:Uncharacterized protein n=1 Tax=Didymodactylos carnosus TaxID=1234261 RepID=A0A815WP40_9BILA|nr:unnamed protein product [Didymodactylos carnosus]CAF4411210.1 unnamed protein product [Didymodactylos carnosus]
MLRISTDAFVLSAYSNRSEFIMNLPTDEQTALRSLQHRDDIIIRPADKNLINFSTLKFIEPKKSSCGTFYILPKIHKKHCPGQPVISGKDHLTSNISDYLERLLTAYVPLLREIAMNDYQVQNFIVLKGTNHSL